MRPVVLRDVQDSDVAVFLEQQLAPEPHRTARTVARSPDEFTANWRKAAAEPTILRKTIVYDGAVAGYLVSMDRREVREVGYWLGRDFWNKGIATEALKSFLAFETTRPLWAGVAQGHLASMRVLEKCGFVLDREDKWPNQAGEEVAGCLFKLA